MSTRTETTVEDLYRIPENGKAEILDGEPRAPLTDDPIIPLGNTPVEDEIEDASENHDHYIYNQD